MLLSALSALSEIVLALALIAGAILAGVRRREHGRAAIIGMVGFLMLLLEIVLRNAMLLALPTLVSSYSESMAAATLFSLVTMLLRIGGIALLIWAVIARRTPTPQPTSWPHPAAQHPAAQHPGRPQQGQPGWQHPGHPHQGAQPGWPQQ